VVGKTVSEKGGRTTTALVRLRSAAPAVLLVVSAPLLGAVAPATHVTQPAWYSILPPLLAIGLALATRRLYTSLLAAILVGGLLAAWQSGLGVVGLVSGLAVAGRALTQSVLDVDQWHVRVDSLLILAYVVFVMTAIAVMAGSGGLQALADRLQRLARSRRSAQVVTFLAGLVVFIDDYANSMIVGSTFRPVADRHGVSRAKLAFIVDATAAPVSGLALLSTWIGYEVGLLGELAQSLGIDKNGYGIFLDAVVFRFYCLAMLAFVLLIGLTGLDFGPMAREERLAWSEAERERRQEGSCGGRGGVEEPARPSGSCGPSDWDRSGSSRWASGDNADGSTPDRAGRLAGGTTKRSVPGKLDESAGLFWLAVGPLLLLVVFFLAGMWVDGGGYRQLSVVEAGVFSFEYWQRVLSQADSIRLLAEASGLCLATSLLLAWQLAGCSAGQLARYLWCGLQSAALPVSVLLLAWGLKQTCDELQTGAYLAELLGQRLWPPLFPALVFVVSCVCSFSTGTSWGTMAILLPTALPVAFQLDGGSYGVTSVLTVAAVLDGAIFGDHCSPISDTTIMSAAASGCDQVVHVQTQLPYALVVAGVVLVVGYLPAGLGLSSGVAVTAVWLTVGALFAGLAVRARWSRSRSGRGPATA